MSGPIKIPKSGFADPGKKFWNNSSEDSPPAKRLKKTELFCYAYEMKKKKKKTPRAKVRFFLSNYSFASFHNFHTFQAKCDDRPLKKHHFRDYFELYGAPDNNPICPIPQCDGQEYQSKAGLIRHLKEQHKVSKQYLDEIKPTIPTRKEKSKCLICGWVVLKTKRTEHFEIHIRR